nr:sigma factor-like helix-turn-helix DNA-binding protein [Kineococcus siccus]
MEAVNEPDRELITLTAWEQLSTADAARVMGITATTARVRLHRARRRLAAHPDLLRLVDEGAPAGPGRGHLRPVVEHH